MRNVFMATIALVSITSPPALAQTSAPPRPTEPRSNVASNISSSNSGLVAPALPAPMVGANATVLSYLHVARTAFAAGRTGEAQQALEMAETRALDRSVVQGQGSTPSNSHLVAQIDAALRAVGAGNRVEAMHRIDAAITTSSAG